jgi:CarD family transcriptional regulator
MFKVGSKVIHSLHGLGVVEAIEEKAILGAVTRFAGLSFDRLKIMANVDQRNSMVRALIGVDQVAGVMEHLKRCETELPTNYTKRYNLNLEKVKSGDIRQLCEVIKSLTKMSRTKKLGHKDQSMLERARKVLAQELSYVTDCDAENMEQVIEQTCHSSLEHELVSA